MAASNYSVNIKLNTKPARTQLEALERRVNRLRTNLNKPLRIEAKALTIQRQQAQLQDKRYATMRVTARLGTQVRKLNEKGLKVDKLRLDINKASKHLDKGRIESARAINKSVADELKGLEKRVQGETKLAGVDRQRLRDLNLIIGKKRVELSLIRTAGKFAAFNARQRKGIGPNNLLGLPSTEALKPGSRGISMLDRDARNLSTGFSAARYGPQPLKGSVAAGATGFSAARYGPQPLKAVAGPTGSGLITLSNKAGRLGGKSAALADRQTALRQPLGLPSAKKLNAEARGIQRIPTASQLSSIPTGGITPSFIATSTEKAAKFEKRINEARKRGIANNKKLIGSEVLRNKQTIRGMKADEKASKQTQKLRSALQKQTDIARGKFAGSGPGIFGPQPRSTFAQSIGIKKGFDTQSALISGAFPLLFGQGPVGAIAGGLGGGIGGMFGEMGGFAGGIAATAVVQQIQGALKGVSDLGSALNDTTKDVEAVTAALGITGTEFEKNLKTLEKLGGEEASFEAARQKMINLVGQEGVTALQNFGKGTTELSNQFTIAMTQMKAAFASFLQGAGAGRFLLNRMKARNLQTQAQTSTDPGVVKAKRLVEALEKGFFTTSDEDAKIRQANAAGENITIDQAKKAVEEAQKLANKKEEQAAIDKLIGDIQKQRVKNISDEIALLERSFGLSADEFEIEKEIMQMKEDGEIKDENEIRNKLKHLQGLEKERQLAEETAAAFEKMSQTIATELSDGIKGMIRGTSTLNDMLNNVLNKMIDAAFNMAMFGNMQGSLGGGGLLGSIFGGLGGLFGGGGGPIDVATPILPTPIYTAANGGMIPGGRASLVGEKGPELFTPATSGFVTPNHALGGSTNVVVNVDASGSSVEGDEDEGRALGVALSAAIETELIKQKRPGGLLA